jgi:ParE toxin of type II toxin-antitoxin system, parDE
MSLGARKPRGPLTVIVSPRATKEIDAAARWWAKRGSPNLIDDAISVALKFVEQFPEAPPLVKIRGRWSTTRRASVEPVGYNLWYLYYPETRTVLVRCFRHKSRRPPRL